MTTSKAKKQPALEPLTLTAKQQRWVQQTAKKHEITPSEVVGRLVDFHLEAEEIDPTMPARTHVRRYFDALLKMGDGSLLEEAQELLRELELCHTIATRDADTNRMRRRLEEIRGFDGENA